MQGLGRRYVNHFCTSKLKFWGQSANGKNIDPAGWGVCGACQNWPSENLYLHRLAGRRMSSIGQGMVNDGASLSSDRFRVLQLHLTSSGIETIYEMRPSLE